MGDPLLSRNARTSGSVWYSGSMTTVTIPNALAERSDLVAIPRDEYERFVAWQRKVKSARTFLPTAAEKRALARARKRRERGDSVTLDDLRRTLATRR